MLTITNAGPGDAGQYSCIVSNFLGPDNSSNYAIATLAVDLTIKVIMNGVDWLVNEYVTACSNSYGYICASQCPLAGVPMTSYDDWATNRYDLVS